jgi:hypothetical protein
MAGGLYDLTPPRKVTIRTIPADPARPGNCDFVT